MSVVAPPLPDLDLESRAALYREASLREKVIEHIFIGDLLRVLWRKGALDIEVLRTEVDRGGYDLALECNGAFRHVQFKSSHRKAKTAYVGVHVNLATKLSGCIIWVLFDQETLALGPFLWFGGQPGEKLPPLGNRILRHTKRDADGRRAERPNQRVLSRGQFTQLATIEDVVVALFGVR